MPLTEKGKEILSKMEETYSSPEKAKEVFYASKAAGTITGVDEDYMADMKTLNDIVAACDAFDRQHECG